MSNENLAVERDDPRQRKLDEMFLEQPYLSATMKAFRMRSGTEVGVISKPVLADGPMAGSDNGWMLERRAALRALVTSLPTPEALLPASVIQVEPVVAVQPSRANQTSSSQAIRVELEVAPLRESAAATTVRAANSEPARTSYPDVLTLAEAAGYLRFGISTVRAWIKQGRIPHIMIGRTVRFRREALEHWLASMEKSGEMPA